MGNEQTGGKYFKEFEKYGKIYIKSDKPYYNPGEQYTGIINLQLQMPYPGNKIMLKLKGREAYQYAYVDKYDPETKQTYPRHRHVKKQETEEILNIKILVYQQEGGFLPGDYAFPISFLIPQGIPGSLYQEGQKCIAEIDYKLQVKVESSILGVASMKYKDELVINENIQINVDKTNQVSQTLEVISCLCMKQGHVTVNARFEKDYLMPGEKARMLFTADSSQCSLECPNITLQIKEKLILGRPGNSQKTLEHVASQSNIEGITQGEVIKDKIIEVALPKYNPLAAKKKKLDLKIGATHIYLVSKFTPNELVPSVNGRIVKSQFSMQLVFNYSGCLVKAPSVVVPIMIYNPVSKSELSMMAPPNWKPQVMPISNLTLPQQPYFPQGFNNFGQQELLIQQSQAQQQQFNSMSGGDQMNIGGGQMNVGGGQIQQM